MRKPWIKNVNKRDAFYLLRYWNGTDRNNLYTKDKDGMIVLRCGRRKQLWNIYRDSLRNSIW